MSKQHLIQLQQRAHKLLQVSSGQQQDQYTVATDRARATLPQNIDLPQFIRYEEDSLSEFGSHGNTLNKRSYRSTDLELLKKCIQLTSENNNLKIMLAQERKGNSQLKEQMKQLYKHQLQLSNHLKMQRQKEKYQKPNQQRTVGNEYIALESELQVMKRRFQSLAAQKQLIEQENSKLSKQMQKKAWRIEQQSRKPVQKLPTPEKTSRAQGASAELAYKYKQSLERNKRLQSRIIEERSKSNRISQFVNREIPMLKDTIVVLTAKLDANLEKYLLRDLK